MSLSLPDFSISASSWVLVLNLLPFLLCLKTDGTYCEFEEGDKYNCRDYCFDRFYEQPQLAYYNYTSMECEPIRRCVGVHLVFHYDYGTNECYTDATMTQKSESYVPSTIDGGTFLLYEDAYSVCANGASAGRLSADSCDCDFLWMDSGKFDINGFPFRCDRVIDKEDFPRYFISETEKDPTTDEVLFYGPYTPQELDAIWEGLKIREKEQTTHYIKFYQNQVLAIIHRSFKKQPLVKDHEIPLAVAFAIGCYLIFAISYLRFEGQIIRVSKREFRQRIESIIRDDNPIYRI